MLDSTGKKLTQRRGRRWAISRKHSPTSDSLARRYRWTSAKKASNSLRIVPKALPSSRIKSRQHELGKLGTLGIHSDPGALCAAGYQPGAWPDAHERSLPAGHNSHARAGKSQAVRIFRAFRERLDILSFLRLHF